MGATKFNYLFGSESLVRLPILTRDGSVAGMTSLLPNTKFNLQTDQSSCVGWGNGRRCLKKSSGIKRIFNTLNPWTAQSFSFFIFKTGMILIPLQHHFWGINQIPYVKPLTKDMAPDKLTATSGFCYPSPPHQAQPKPKHTCCCNTVESIQLGKLSRFCPRRGSRAEANKLTIVSLSHSGPSFPSLLNWDNLLCLLSLRRSVAAIRGSQKKCAMG